MTEFKPSTHKTVAAHLRKFADWLDGEPEEIRRFAADEINKLLDRWCDDDAFGTEGQQDPRGDHRR